jgi:protein-tyrosine phosphatase
VTLRPPLVDLHNHLIPGVDDGARELADSLDALAAMHAQGVRRVVATPHIDASLLHRPGALHKRMLAVDAAWEQFRVAAGRQFPEVRLGRGFEIMLDVPQLSLDDPRLRLGGGRAVLVEFPRMSVPIGSVSVLESLRRQGWIPVVAHPERYVDFAARDLSTVEEWRRVGAVMAVNAGSLMGGFGDDARGAAREMLRRGWVDLIGSDYHARTGRRPLLLHQVFDALDNAGGTEQATLLMCVNPARLLDGEDTVEVPPLALHDSVWSRIRQLLRGS